MFSILIPTYNNLEYLKICINSIKKNSKFKHQIIVHVNEGSDKTIEYLKKNNLDFTYSEKNIGMSLALNTASKLAKLDYILISHDDFYYCPNWDTEFVNELNLLNHKNFYLSGTMVNAASFEKNDFLNPPYFNAGLTFKEFDEVRLLENLNKIKTIDFQGSTKHPALVHIDIWKKVGGWSEDYFPTGGDDSDFNMKLWNENIRIFKGLGKSSVYHFGSTTTRKKDKSLFTYLGSKGNKIFLKKWKIGIYFFEKFYLRSYDGNRNKILNRYDGPLTDPIKNIEYYFELLKTKLHLFYLKIINYK
jgi:GT2 family glycosyltransferase